MMPFLAPIPTGVWGDLADFQGITFFLASDASDFLQAAVILVDGGCLCK